MTFCVLVTSADNRKDIFDMCFANSEKIWKHCPWPRYAGFTTPQPEIYGFKMLASGRVNNWCEQVIAHVNALPPEITHILLMVEDVLFMQPVEMIRLDALAKTIKRARMKYTRLVPLREHPMIRFIKRLSWSNWARTSIEIIPQSHPYYSSTEMVIWQRDYLLQQLAKETDAWRFEHIISETEHWAVVDPVFDQHQIVQKGKWNWEAPYFMAQVMNMPYTYATHEAIGNILEKIRPFQSIGARLRGHWQNLSFALFGFTSFKIKRGLHETYRRHSGSLPRS